MNTIKPKQPHGFVADPDLGKDVNGRYEICMCSLPRENAIHRLPETDDAEHRRRAGERN